MNIINKIATRHGFKTIGNAFIRHNDNGTWDEVHHIGTSLRVDTFDRTQCGIIVGNATFNDDEVDDFDDYLSEIA